MQHLREGGAPRRRPLVAATLVALLAAACADKADRLLAPESALPTPRASADAAAPRYDLRSYDVDAAGVTLTSLSGINAAGHLAGWYKDGSGLHGFVDRNGRLESIDHPDGQVTFVRGIGPDGDVVGSYIPKGEAVSGINQRGFLRTSTGEFLPAGDPDFHGAIPQRILADGTILGCVHQMDLMDSMHGYARRGSSSSVLDIGRSMHNGATADGGTIVGLFRDPELGRGRAYRIDDGVFQAFDVPGSAGTQAWDVDPSGRTIVGLYAKDGAVHGFVLEDGLFTTIDYPGATYTDVIGINARGDIVGTYDDANGVTHGYVGRRLGAR